MAFCEAVLLDLVSIPNYYGDAGHVDSRISISSNLSS